jgi:amino acid adenylation domain-containing protein
MTQPVDVLAYFAKQVWAHPQQVAVVCGALQLSYAELERESNQLAQALRHQGVLPGEPVGLLLNKHIRAIVAILAIWKVGALYVPLDPAAPKERIKNTFSVCNMRVVVLDEVASQDFVAAWPAVTCIDVASAAFPAWPLVEDFSAHFQAESVNPKQLAYIIFTSGSTGLPKGVAISRESLSYFVMWCETSLGINHAMSAMNIADLSFDQSVMDVAFLLGSGISLHLYGGHKDPVSISQYIQRHQINILSTVPTIFGMCFDPQFELSPDAFSSLKKAFIGGAACPPPYVNMFYQLMPTADVYNMYGPTEVTVYCMFHQFTREQLQHGVDAVSLGLPLPGHRVALLDDAGNDTPDRGELVVFGPQVMAGYWGSPEKTAEVVLEPCRAGVSPRGYHTGDIVDRRGVEGYTFMGRKNETIKSGGYRIDLGEIETAMIRHPDVVHAAAVAVPDSLLENTIHVFIGQGGRGGLQQEALRQHVASLIPAYMQPKEIYLLPELPLNSSGKIDKRRLTAEAAARQHR